MNIAFFLGGNPPALTEVSLWGSTGGGLLIDVDSNAVVLGLKFKSSVAGNVTGVRFYKNLGGSSGTHVGTLFNMSQTLLAQVTFTGETSSGWQEMRFSSPVSISANTIYVVAVHHPNGLYSATVPFFGTATVNGVLTGVAASESINGVYRYTATPTGFPDQTYNSGNYWTDVLFIPT